MNDFLEQFLIESREFVVQATDGLLALEKNPRDAETLDTVFRAFHTLKGGAGIVEFTAMENALHSTETLLHDARTGKRLLDRALIGNCLASLDRVSHWLDTLEQTGELPVLSDAAFAKGAAPESRDWLTDLLDRHADAFAHAATAFRFAPDPDCFFKGEDPLAQAALLSQLLALDIEPANPWPPLGELDPYTCNIALSGLTASGSDAVAAHFRSLSGDCEIRSLESAGTEAPEVALTDLVRKVLLEQIAILDVEEPSGGAGRLASAGLTAANALRYCGLSSQAEDLTRAARQALARNSRHTLRSAIALLLDAKSLTPSADVATPLATAPLATARAEAAVRTLRVNAQQVDALVRLTGELTVVKNAIGHSVRLAEENGDSTAALLSGHNAALSRLITQMQNAVIGMRVLPLRTVLQRFPRVVREMALNIGKPVQIHLEGEDTEGDKTIVEMLFEPLLHVVRNAIDHGVEDAERRRAAGKPPVASIVLRAARDGEQILIEVTDDGRGIDVEQVRKVALDRGVANAEDLRTMAESDIIDLVFAPGFSTAARVTEISGRGVGMDAVRTAVAKVGGRVSIASRAGQGTTVSFSLPFSIMMTQVLTVEAGGQLFGIPLDAVVETVSLPREGISWVGEARVMVQRNRTIPIVDLGSVLHAVQENSCGDPADATVIISAIASQLVGLQVDRVGERMDIMLKPLEGLLSGTPGIAGTTVMGDGRVLLVLDISGILQ